MATQTAWNKPPTGKRGVGGRESWDRPPPDVATPDYSRFPIPDSRRHRPPSEAGLRFPLYFATIIGSYLPFVFIIIITMICVSIGRGRHRHMIAEYRHLVDQGASLVELRLDYLNGEINLSGWSPTGPARWSSPAAGRPTAASAPAARSSGRLLLRTAIAEGVEYVDLEDDVAGSIPPVRPHEADRQPPRLPQDARRPGRNPPPPVPASTPTS